VITALLPVPVVVFVRWHWSSKRYHCCLTPCGSDDGPTARARPWSLAEVKPDGHRAVPIWDRS